eukprot:evm.model.scf_2591.2 EVM.evm.TU.scf_2591.2   scf_2591:14562-15647(+)
MYNDRSHHAYTHNTRFFQNFYNKWRHFLCCPVPMRSQQAYQAQAGTSNDAGQPLHEAMGAAPLWDSGLTFWNPEWERDYAASRPLSKGDAVVHCCGGLAFVGILRKHGHSLKVLVLGVPMVAVSICQLCWMRLNGQSYSSWRNWNLVALRLGIVTTMSIIMCETSDESTTKSLGVAASLLLTSNVMALTTLASTLRLPFRLHVMLHFVCTCIGMLFVPPYCSKWGDEYESDFRAIGSSINGAMDTLMLNSRETILGSCGVIMNCSSIVYFWQWSLGFFLSGAVEYTIESYSRTAYLVAERITNGDSALRLWAVWRQCVVLAFWCMLVGVVTVWTALEIVTSSGCDGVRSSSPLHSTVATLS